MVGKPYNQAAFSLSLERERKERKEKKKKKNGNLHSVDDQTKVQRGLLSPQGHPSPSGQPWSGDQGPQAAALVSSPGLACLLQTHQKHRGGSRTPGCRGDWILVPLWKDPWLDPSPCWASGVALESYNTSFKAVTSGLGFCDCKLLAPEHHPVQCSSHVQLLN